MPTLSEIKKSALVSLWFMFLTFPIMVIRVNTTEKLVLWRWQNMVYVGIGSFLLSFVWRYLLWRKEIGKKDGETGSENAPSFFQRVLSDRRYAIPAIVAGIGLCRDFSFCDGYLSDQYHDHGPHVHCAGAGAKYRCRPCRPPGSGICRLLCGRRLYLWPFESPFRARILDRAADGCGDGCFFRILLGFPVLRLRGDYLAIVTLGFGEIIRLILENWNEFSYGPSGIAHISRPFPVRHSTVSFRLHKSICIL